MMIHFLGVAIGSEHWGNLNSKIFSRILIRFSKWRELIEFKIRLGRNISIKPDGEIILGTSPDWWFIWLDKILLQ